MCPNLIHGLMGPRAWSDSAAFQSVDPFLLDSPVCPSTSTDHGSDVRPTSDIETVLKSVKCMDVLLTK